ncbi:hypothetical protein JVT61DRAFT_12207 [Boletus reticuloceps]|uniref:Uncharacterized protein n=1 Tax=Boletus reticuloceps TaxID=495285 RepID=A0A8I2YEB6_9AGAM|nr:hypothetical protein JVT61DRAFT_12207 [Boletus reticuloceps]
MPGILTSTDSEFHPDHSIYPDEFWEEIIANLNDDLIYYPPHTLVINGQNMLVHNHGGTLFDILRNCAPHWYHIANEAYVGLYSWHGTTDARPLLRALALTLIDQAIESFTAIDPTWSVENVRIPIGDGWCTTAFGDPVFMNSLKETIIAAQTVFYTRTLESVRFLLLPSDAAPWQHPGVIPTQRLVTRGQIDYVNSLVIWNSRTGYNLWHDFRPNEDGTTVLCWFDRHSLKFLMDTIHSGVGSPGYLCIQELYANLATGREEWGPLSAATFHSTTWILAVIHVCLWADVLGNQRFLIERFTVGRRDAILEKQAKISIFLRQILRKRVPGLTVEQNEYAYHGLHRFMHTNPDVPLLF